MAKCIVTGGAGFIGSHVVDTLIENGHDVLVVDNLSTGKKKNINRQAHFVKADIRHLGLLYSAEYVFHLAALARIQPSIKNPVQSHDVNLTGTLKVLEYCREVGAKLIFSSSSSIYEGSSLPTKENDPIEPKNPYAAQKYMAEQYIELYSRLYDMDYTILRYFNVFGERQILSGAYAAVVGIFLEQKSNGEPLSITGNGEQTRDFTYVKDVARANLLAMEWHRSPYNIGTGKSYSIKEIASFVKHRVRHIGAREGEVGHTLADNYKALKHGWTPEVTIRDWINDNA